jgi:hypothetical protein
LWNSDAERKKIPKEMKCIKLLNSYECKSLQCVEIPNMLCTTWLDKKQIYVLSTNSKDEVCKVSRRKGSEKLLVTCPSSIAKYNKYMGGVDLADQRRKYFTLSRKSRKWWMYFFTFLFDTSINNAYIIYLTTNYPHPKQKMQLYDFKLAIIEELCTEITSQKRKCPTTISLLSSEHEHKRQKIDGRKRTCSTCRKYGKKTNSGRPVESSWECATCKICLCKTCFTSEETQIEETN